MPKKNLYYKLEKLQIHEDSLEIRVKYDYIFSKEEEKQSIDYYQWRFSQKTGKQVPKEEIKVRPRAGERAKTESWIRASLDDENLSELFYHLIHKRAPHVLPKLAKDLKDYRIKNYEKKLLVNGEETDKLISYTIKTIYDVIKKDGTT